MKKIEEETMIKDELSIRAAQVRDEDALRRIAFNSEAHWGYSEEFMKIFDENYNITETFLKNNPVYVIECSEEVIGFWGMETTTERFELEYFYIAEEHLRKGFGRVLWNNLLLWCTSNKVQEFNFVTSPQAVQFYLKSGAIKTGEVPSTIDRRMIPELLYSV